MVQKVVVAMPQYNESRIVANFLVALKGSFDQLDDIETRFVVIDDCSTDDSMFFLNQMIAQKFPLTLIRNKVNLGHGPSTVLALKTAISLKPDIVVALDGDAQFSASDVAAVVSRNQNHRNAVVECIRKDRAEPFFRKFVSFATRIILLLRTHKYVPDPNTPMRIYRSDFLHRVLEFLPDTSLIPNLRISVISRKLTNEIGKEGISFLMKSQLTPSTMFGQGKIVVLPSKRFVKFCMSATKEWITSSRFIDKSGL